MTATVPVALRVEARIDPAERPTLVAAQHLLARHLSDAEQGKPWPVEFLLTRKPGFDLGPPAVAAILLSMLPDALSEAPLAEVEARWRDELTRLGARGVPVFIITVFRHVPERDRSGGPSPRLERIRALNLLAPHLAHAFGATVIDLDRALAHVGAAALKTDYRLSGDSVAIIAAHTVAWSLLSYGLDDFLDVTQQETAKAKLGPLAQVAARYRRRLEGSAA